MKKSAERSLSSECIFWVCETSNYDTSKCVYHILEIILLRTFRGAVKIEKKCEIFHTSLRGVVGVRGNSHTFFSILTASLTSVNTRMEGEI